MKVKLKKKWRDRRAGASLSILGGDLAVERGGAIRNRATGKLHTGPVVDPEQALQMRRDGYLASPVKKGKRNG